MKAKRHYIWTNIKLVCTIVPTVLIMIIIFFILVRKEVLTLSREKLALESQYYAEEISTWAGSVLSEVTIYKTMIEQLGLDKEDTYELLTASAGTHDAYPYGLYMGDDQGNYFDSSGWIPEDDFVVTEREWYIEGLHHDHFVFGEPYVDAMTGSTCMSVTCRLDSAPAVTVLAADVYLDYASQLVSEVASDKIEHAFFVTRDSRLIVADSNASMVGQSLSAKSNSLLYQNISALLDADKTGQNAVLGDESLFFVDINMIPNTDWYFVTCMNRNEILRDLWRLEFPILILAVIACILLFILTSLFSREMSTIRSQARLDPFTRLLNREGFEELVRVSLEERPGQGILIIIDLDNFKLVNDQYGHLAGDQALKEFSSLLESYFNRNKDIVSHMAGDEFAVFVGRDITTTEAEAMLQKFMTIMHQTFDNKYPHHELSASIGVGVAARCDSYEILYQNANNALNESKQDGKDRFQIH